MPTRVELTQLVDLRLREAVALQAANLHAGAYYLAGYVVELALKACICRVLRLEDYPDTEVDRKPFMTHKAQDLVLIAGLRNELQQKLADQEFADFWNLIEDWKPEHRYKLGKTRQDADDLLEALNHSGGVLPWLSSKW